MLKAIESSKINLEMVFSNMEPEMLGGEKRAWMIHLLNKVKHGFLVATGERQGIPVVHILTQGSSVQPVNGVRTVFTVGVRAEDLQILINVITNMAIALYQLISVVYTAAFSQQETLAECTAKQWPLVNSAHRPRRRLQTGPRTSDERSRVFRHPSSA